MNNLGSLAPYIGKEENVSLWNDNFFSSTNLYSSNPIDVKKFKSVVDYAGKLLTNYLKTGLTRLRRYDLLSKIREIGPKIKYKAHDFFKLYDFESIEKKGRELFIYLKKIPLVLGQYLLPGHKLLSPKPQEFEDELSVYIDKDLIDPREEMVKKEAGPLVKHLFGVDRITYVLKPTIKSFGSVAKTIVHEIGHLLKQYLGRAYTTRQNDEGYHRRDENVTAALAEDVTGYSGDTAYDTKAGRAIIQSVGLDNALLGKH